MLLVSIPLFTFLLLINGQINLFLLPNNFLPLFKLILNKVHVILADSNDLVRVGLRTVLNSFGGIKIVGEAKENDELIEQIKNFGASVVVIDYTSPGFDIDIIPKVLNDNKEVKILAITPEQSAQTLVNALRSGVTSYVKKDCDLSEIQNAVKETARGNKFFCGQILETIQKASIDVNDIDFDSLSCEAVILSERENEIITLIAEGLTNGQIAEQLFLSNHTINTHRKNIMAKLGVKNTAGIVMYAVKTQLVSPNKFLFAAEG
jgi:DNA-binding NarL/FixJ family response regulator